MDAHCACAYLLCTANTAVAQNMVNGVDTTIIWGTTEVDTDSAMDTSTGVFTVPAGKAGHYEVFATWQQGTASLAYIKLFVNGVLKKSSAVAVNSFANAWVSAILNLSAGDTIQIKGATGQGSPQPLAGGATANFISIKWLPT